MEFILYVELNGSTKVMPFKGQLRYRRGKIKIKGIRDWDLGCDVAGYGRIYHTYPRAKRGVLWPYVATSVIG